MSSEGKRNRCKLRSDNNNDQDDKREYPAGGVGGLYQLCSAKEIGVLSAQTQLSAERSERSGCPVPWMSASS